MKEPYMIFVLVLLSGTCKVAAIKIAR